MSGQRHRSGRRGGLRFPSILIDKQWEIISVFVRPLARSRRRPRHVDLRQLVSTILYVPRTGCSWRQVPRNCPARETDYGYCPRWNEDGTMARIHEGIREAARKKERRKATPSGGIVDSQSLRSADTVGRATPGYDAGKKILGCHRDTVVDTIGIFMVIMATAASTRDRDGGSWRFV